MPTLSAELRYLFRFAVQYRQLCVIDPYELCHLKIKNKPQSIFDYQYEDFCCADYQAHEHIKAAISI